MFFLNLSSASWVSLYSPDFQAIGNNTNVILQHTKNNCRHHKPHSTAWHGTISKITSWDEAAYVGVSCLCVVRMCPLPLLTQFTTEGGVPSHCELIAFTLGDEHTPHKETSSTALNLSLAQARGALMTWTLGTTNRCPKWALRAHSTKVGLLKLNCTGFYYLMSQF